MATVQLRNPGPGRDYFDRQSRGKDLDGSHAGLKRRLSDIVYRQMANDATAALATGPGGHRGTLRLQRDRLSSPHRLFGEVTSRTRRHQP